ncbi:MAG: helix-turn-helix transcriptional regulator [Pseudomonadota bacterium]
MDQHVTISREDYEALLSAREELEDIQAIEAFRQKLADGQEELLPSGFVDRMLDGESLIKLWREHRGLSQDALAEAAGVPRPNISAIEKGRRGASVETLKRIADALNVRLDDLV